MKINLSAVVMTLNEEKNIGRCLDSLQGVVEETLVVDSYSTDGTKEIALEKGAKVLEHPFEGFVEQRRYAVQKAEYNHVLVLDADEALSTELRKKIAAIKNNWKYDGYYFNRLTNYCGKWIRHCSWYPDKKLRMWDRRKITIQGENPHDKIFMKQGSSTKWIKKDILHFSFPSIESHVKTANHFSEVAAREALKKNKKIVFVIHVLLNPFYTFLNKYFFRLGFLDGFYGFVICSISAFANFLKYSKAYQLRKSHHA